MTAASPSERPPVRPRGVRALALLLAALLAWTPWALAWGDDFRASIKSGRATAAAGLSSATPPPQNNFSFATGGANNAINLEALYGQDAATVAAGQQQQLMLLQESSAYGSAYRAVFAGLDKPRPDMTNDPLWTGTDQVLDNFADISRTFADCQDTIAFRQSQRAVHIPDYQYCDRLPDMNARCTLLHDYDWPNGLPFVLETPAQLSACGARPCDSSTCPLETCANPVSPTMVAQCLSWPWGAAPEAQRLQNACLSACQASNIDPNAMTAAYPGAVCLRITSSTATFALRLTDRARMRGMLPASSAPAGTGGIRYAIREQWTTTPHVGCRYVEGGWWCPAGSAGSNGHCIQYAGGTWCQFQAQTMSYHDYPLPTRHGVDGGLDRINANGATTFSANQEQREVCTERCSWRTDPDSGAQTYDCGQVCQPGWVQPPASVDAWFMPITTALRDTWSGTDECIAAAGRINNGFCTGSVVCEELPTLPASGCYEASGVHICANNLRAPPIAGINRFCRRARVTVDCNGFNRGPMACWTDAQGQQQCPRNDGGNRGDCAALEADPNCGFISAVCVEGASDAFGNCFYKEEKWDCGTLQGVPVLERLRNIACSGPVRCVGTDCMSPSDEQSQDFGAAVAALQTLQAIISEARCNISSTNSGDCDIFVGEARTCKRAVGGVVNCCKTPEGININDYITLTMAVLKVDTAVMGLQQGTAIRGAWEVLRAPVADTWSAVTQSFSSIANTLTGSVTQTTSDAAAQLGLTAAKQQLMAHTAQWAAQVFGDAAVNALFSVAGTGGAAVSGGVVQGPLQLGGGAALLGTALTVVMWAYMLYSVAMILVKLIWTCEKSEFELGVKRELKACHKVGSFCHSEVFGVCVEKRESFCCFNSPLARIMNEQIRPQLGREWGPAKRPDCRGIRLSELSSIDWQAVDLSEWLALLTQSGNFPTAATLSIDDLTGDGSLLAAGGTRANAAVRAEQRASGIDAEAVRANAEGQLWTEARSSTPRPPPTNPPSP